MRRTQRKLVVCSSAALVASVMINCASWAGVNPVTVIGNEVNGAVGSGDKFFTNPPTDTTTGSTGLGVPWYNATANDANTLTNGPATNNVGWQLPGGGNTSHTPYTMSGAIGSPGSPAIGATEGVSSMKVTTPGVNTGPDSTGEILGAQYSSNSSYSAFMQSFTSSNLVEADITLPTAPVYVGDGSPNNDTLGVYFRLTYKDEGGGSVDSGGSYSGYRTTTDRTQSYVTFASGPGTTGETGTKTMIWNYGELAGLDNLDAGALGLDNHGSSFYVRLDLDSTSKNPITYYIDNIRFASRQLTYTGGATGTITNSANWSGLNTNAANAYFAPGNTDQTQTDPAYLANHVIINDSLHFGLSGAHTVTNDEGSFTPDGDGAYGVVSNSQYGGLVFDSGAGAFTLQGNAIDIAGDIDNNSTSVQTITTPLRLMNPINFNSTSGGNLKIMSAISSYTDANTGTLQSTQFGVTVGGSGVVTLGGTNTYKGVTTVNGNAILDFTSAGGYGGTVLIVINPNAASGVDTGSTAASFLAKIANAYTTGWTGTVPANQGDVGTGALALSTADASTNIDFTGTVGGAANLSAAGLSGLSIGALAGEVTYTGTITPPTTGGFANRYRLGGGGTLTLPNGLGGAANSAEITNLGTVVLTGSSTYGGATTVDSGATLNVGNATLAGALPSTTVLTSNGNTNFAANPGTGILTRTIGGLTVSSTGQVVVTNPTGGVHANRTVLSTGALTFGGTTGGWQGLVNLNGNDMIVKNGNITNITDQLKQGFNAHAGYWNGTAGIISSTAAGDTRFLTTLGSRQSAGTAFDGVSTTTNDVLIKYTYYGDANLDGVVNGADYQQIDMGFGTAATGWQNGDFNYDGLINGSDFALIDNTFNQITATNASALGIAANAVSLDASPAAITAVPEPATLGLLGIGALNLLGRRRKNQNLTAR